MNISIKNAPDDLVRRLKERAARNHRSLQGEVLEILTKAAQPEKLSPAEAYARVKSIGLKTKGDSVKIIRAARDGR
jgi:plasmid stability protein